MVLETIKNNILKMTEEKSKQSISDLWTYIKCFNIQVFGRGKGSGRGRKNQGNFLKIITENFPTFGENNKCTNPI